jgi:hypothetical protein
MLLTITARVKVHVATVCAPPALHRRSEAATRSTGAGNSRAPGRETNAREWERFDT